MEEIKERIEALDKDVERIRKDMIMLKSAWNKQILLTEQFKEKRKEFEEKFKGLSFKVRSLPEIVEGFEYVKAVKELMKINLKAEDLPKELREKYGNAKNTCDKKLETLQWVLGGEWKLQESISGDILKDIATKIAKQTPGKAPLGW